MERETTTPALRETASNPALRCAIAELTEAFLSGRSASTLRAYQADLADFCRFLRVDNVDDAAGVLLARSHGQANALALSWRAHLVEEGYAPATVNRRLAALRSLVAYARTIGFVSWELEVSNVAARAYRDTRGPGADGFQKLLAAVDRREDAKGLRDRAILRLLYDLALRRAEVVRMDLEDVDLDAGTVAIVGKGRAELELRTLPEQTRRALAAWIDVRGEEDGPLFVNFDPAGKGDRLTGRSVYRIVKRLGERAGVRARPHGLRHAAITTALDATDGNVRAVQRFSRHRDLRTLNVYDDNREDLAGEVARLVAATA